MALQDSWNSKEAVISYLAYQLNQGRLALVLGAGVSSPMGLPGWGELIEQMFHEKGQTPPSGLTLPQQAELYKTDYYKTDEKAFKRAVRSALYKEVDVNFNVLRNRDTLASIGSLVMSSRRGSASKVITFNFDDLLELYLQYHGFVVSSVFEKQHWESNADVIVFHPHGLLSQTDESKMSSDLVFDQQSFSKVIGDQDDPWHQKILTIMRSHTCIFLGLSGDDVNLDNLLIKSKETHAAESEGILYSGVRFSKNLSDSNSKLWRNRGIHSIKIDDYDNDIPPILFKICQEAALSRQ